MKLRLHLGERHACIMQDFQNLSLIASAALGGSKGKDTPTQADIPQSREEMIDAFNNVFGN